MLSLSSYECNLKTMVRGLSLLWLLYVLGVLWGRSIFALFILSLDFNMIITFSLR